MAVYFIQQVGGVGPIKIGLARNVADRIEQIQAMCPVPLEVILEIDTNKAAENHLHKKFASLRLHGEWFEPARELLDFIKSPELPDMCYGPRRRNIPKPKRCKGIKVNGRSCGNIVTTEDYCPLHKEKRERPPTCRGLRFDGKPCLNTVTNDDYCHLHKSSRKLNGKQKLPWELERDREANTCKGLRLDGKPCLNKVWYTVYCFHHQNQEVLG